MKGMALFAGNASLKQTGTVRDKLDKAYYLKSDTPMDIRRNNCRVHCPMLRVTSLNLQLRQLKVELSVNKSLITESIKVGHFQLILKAPRKQTRRLCLQNIQRKNKVLENSMTRWQTL